MKAFFAWLLCALALAAPADDPRTTLSDPSIKFTVPEKPYVVLRRGHVEAVIADNRAVDDDVLKAHRAGYSGVASLKHEKRRENLFVPPIAGLNFEHIHDGTTQPRPILYEPRNAPMELRVIDAHTAELYQKPTPHWGLESCQRYHLLDDGTIELTIECVARKRSFKNGYIGLFWASYINQPQSSEIQFLGHPEGADRAPRWVRASTPEHGVDATHLASGDTREFAHDADFPMTLVFTRSKWRYTQPWYFGATHGMAYAQIFRDADRVRFSQSPSGGGRGNPAWDFQFFIPDYKTDHVYRFVMRAAYLPYASPDDLRRAIQPHITALNAATAAVDQPKGSLLDVVRRYADTMIERGRDTYGPQKTGLFLSALDRTTFSALASRPAAPAGIRREDRSGEPWSALSGANPHLDQNFLRILYALTQITNDPKYAKAADEELAWFLKNALSPKTSLLPWGEHMSWDVIQDKPISGGNDVFHEFARPWVLWDRCFELAPDQSRRFAIGLWDHQIANQKTGGFDRHAPYFEHGPVDGKDFPRHAGFYILTWAHAYKHASEPLFLKAIETLLARFERKRITKDGTMTATIGPLDCESAARLVPEPLSARLRAFAEKEDELILADLRRDPVPGIAPELREPPLWRNGYSANTYASTAMFCLARHEQVAKPAYRDVLVAIADKYVNSVPEEDLDVWPLAFAHAISAQAAAYRFTNKPVYLEQAQRLSRLALGLYWQDNPLPRASLKTGHYEAITGSDSLALALLHVHALEHPLPVNLPSNTIDR
jgi:hypothetical protein